MGRRRASYSVDPMTRGSGVVPRHWWGWVTGWTAVGLGVRVAAVLGRPHRAPGGDAFFYHGEANLLAAGHGFINPFLYYGMHRPVPTASFPPGFVLVLAAAWLVGLKSFLARRLWCCVLGAAAVTVGALAGRRIGGPRAGIIAAALIALHPNLWMPDELAFSECLTPLLVAAVLLAAYRLRERGGPWDAAGLGLTVGVAAMVRDELALLGVLLVVPLTLGTWHRPARARLVSLGAAAAAAVLVVGPWVGYNLTRFEKPVYISSGLGVTLASANCPPLWSGPQEGYWSQACATAVAVPAAADESVQAAAYQSAALRFIRSHESRLVPVVAARLGRAFGLFHPLQQIRFDARVETRPYHWALLGLVSYYGLVILALGGAALLRSRHQPLWPLVAVGLTVAVSVVVAFGDTRYRIAFEMALVLSSSVYLDAVWSHRRPRHAADGAGAAPVAMMGVR